ncbi:MAG: hypothetical protein COS26_00250 [Candidatus Nealsonbacteria bacterium CG02_land_8_20_14_3_00_40_11]|uniref:Uncharacterized protein n=1 Tax=Candidatus Nealsonbacteria bacterium CG02_land_8_20_14_3_00_40_11 TaxID=1974700 RepID=A0A2M7D8Q7_9BACT|nr:MAG: hypothetical protein COS26_00250 [Candidatus Nealsonbacteria bacterium CG02_land_8_20_14_3_00_40_11]
MVKENFVLFSSRAFAERKLTKRRLLKKSFPDLGRKKKRAIFLWSLLVYFNDLKISVNPVRSLQDTGYIFFYFEKSLVELLVLSKQKKFI